MTLTPTDIAAILGAATVLIGALAAGAVSIIGALAKKVDAVAEKTTAIEAHVNSDKTAMLERETSLRQEIAILREFMAKDKQAAALLAQSVATAVVLPEHTTPSALAETVKNGGAVAANIADTAKSTAETAKNTAKTDAKIQDMKDHQS